jgi:uncharacterized protein YjbI with pentapeptide repeats/GNAT superfamily N-acetyltransferase
MMRRHNPDTTGRKPPKGLVVFTYYSEDGDARMDRWAEKAWKIANASPIRILSNRELTAIAVIGNTVVGGGWSAVEHPFSDDVEGTFTFDIVVDPKSQGKGVGDALVEEMLNQFRSVRDMGDAEYVLDVEVVNPAMERILARRGFRLRDEEDPRAVRGRTMMTRNPRRNGRVLRRNRRNPEMSVHEIERELVTTGRPFAPTYDKDAYASALAGVKRLVDANLAGADLRGADLRGAYLLGADLRFADLSGANLDRAILEYATLEGTDFTGASLKGATLEDAKAYEAIFSEANLEGAALIRTRLGNATFRGANLRKANLHGAIMGETVFAGADLEGANLSRAHLTGADFRGARLRDATLAQLRGEIEESGDFGGLSAGFQSADLRGADLQGSRFTDADFENADLWGANLPNVTFTRTRLVDVDLTRANLRGTRFVECIMEGAVGTPAERVRDPDANLVALDFSNAILTGVDFSGRDLRNATFSNALLDGASFARCEMPMCDFSKADMDNADFTRVYATGANFAGASARGANFTKATLNGTDFQRADLHKADFSEAVLAHANLSNATAYQANFSRTDMEGVKAAQARFSHASFSGADLHGVNFSGSVFMGADFSRADLRGVSFNGADLTGASLENAAHLAVSVSGATMDSATRALLFAPRSAYGKMSGPILKMDKPDAPTKAAEFKKTYPREFERLKGDTGGKDFLPAIKDAIRTKYRSVRPWVVTRGTYTSSAQRYCGSPNNVLKFNLDLTDGSFTPAQQDNLRKLAETSRHSGHPYEKGDLFTVGWVRYCSDDKNKVWLVEEVQSDVSIVREKLKENDFPAEFREVVEILAPVAERFYYDALGVVFEMAAEKGYEVEMLDYLAKKDMGSPRSVYTDLPRAMGMERVPVSITEGFDKLGTVWRYKPNPRGTRRPRNNRSR